MSKSEFAYWHHSMRVLPHRTLSSFMRPGQDKDLLGGHWRRGDFIALLTGVTASEATEQARMLLRDEANKGDGGPLHGDTRRHSLTHTRSL